MYWYEEEIEHLEKVGSDTGYDPEIIFYGSSSIRMWDTLQTDFPQQKTVNLGFGGSTLAACVWFFKRVMKGYHPKALVIYAGDNDLGDGRNPEEVLIFFQQLKAEVKQRFGDELPCYFMSLKPSPSRWHMVNQFVYTNSLIQKEINKGPGNWHFLDIYKKMLDASGLPKADLYQQDGLHLSVQGYQLWKEIVNLSLMQK
jgi:lysophospholipase L1-like esterase